ncbi:MAG: TIGR03663 family protein [Chloroflexi bacterium]|nr:TIGR03663 family protein [Chloroflexota bacterium]
MSQTMERPAIIDEGATARGSALGLPVFGAISLNWEIAAYAALVLVAATLRFWDLGTRALHHDESLHALYSYYLFSGRGYQHDPMMHGPFQFHAIALGYFLFGVSDYTARIVPALFGTVLVALPYFLRGFLGRTGAILAAVMLTFSPDMLYYSRFARNDIYIAVWTMLLVIALWRYVAERRNSYLYIAAAVVSLSFATKEVAFITLAIFIPFMLVLGIGRILRLNLTAKEITSVTLYLFVYYLVGLGLGRLLRLDLTFHIIILSLGPVAGGIWLLVRLSRKHVQLAVDSLPLLLALFLGTFYVPQLSAGVTIIQQRLNLNFLGQTSLLSITVPASILGLFLFNLAAILIGALIAYGVGRLLGRIWAQVFMACFYALSVVLGLSAILARQPLKIDINVSNNGLAGGLVVTAALAITGVIGYWVFRRAWVISAGIFYAIYVLLYTTFFTNIPGFGTGIWGSLGYWLLQHGVKRGDQPQYYYLILLAVYEFLPVALALVAMVYYARKRNIFALFLIYWSILAAIAYAVAGEKMPWLLLHMSLPLILLAADFLGEMIDKVRWRTLLNRHSLTLALLIPALLIGMLAVFRVIGPANASAAVGMNPSGIGLVLLVAIGLAVAAQAGSKLGLARSLQVLGFVAIAVMFLLTVRSAFLVTYKNGDIPVEMLVYTQTSPEVPKIKEEIDRIALRSGQGKDLKITVDANGGFSWPWAWYLRDYKNVDYPVLSNIGGPPIGSILLLHDGNADKAKPFLTKYGLPQKYHHRWWFPEDYRGLTPGGFWNSLFDGANWGRWWRYLLYRDIPNQLGSENGQFYVQKDLVGTTITRAAPPEPPREYTERQLNVRSVITIGTKGSATGQLSEPKAVAVDKQGNVYVMDSLNRRVEKFDATGKFLAQVGREGTGEGEFMPNTGGAWGIAVDAEGFVYVADTWNHRVQKFDSELRFVAKWGENVDTKGVAPGNGGKFYGPRGIAVDGEGNLYVTDTGNHRVQKFNSRGEFLGAFGGIGSREGQFLEPVGIGVDVEGTIYVADTWNHRIQKFDKDFRFVAQIPVNGWESTGVMNKPHLAVEPAGNVLVADPENHRLLRFSPGGTLLAVINKPGTDSSSFNLPIGVTTDAAGNIYVADSGNHRIQKFEALK